MPERVKGPLMVPLEVELARGDQRRVEMLTAATPALATRMADLMFPEHEVVRVSRHWHPEAVCARCGCIIFTGDGHRRREGTVRCWECAGN